VARSALVLGATGHLGQALVRRLAQGGYRVTATTRASDAPELEGLPVEIDRGNADAPGQIDAWVVGHDLVVDASAPSPLTRFVRSGPEGSRPVEHAVARVRAVLAAVRRHGAGLVFVSSFVTTRRSSDLGVTDRLRRLGHPYFRAKLAMEREVLDAARDGLPAAVLNPGAFLGPWAFRAEASLVHHVLTGRVLLVADTVVNVIDVRDVARYVIAAAETQAWGRPIAVAGHNVRLVELVRRIAGLGGVAAPTATVRAGVAEAWAAFGEATLAWAGLPPPQPWLAASLIADATAMEPSAEQRRFDVTVRPLEETLADSVSWHARRNRAAGG